MIQQYVSSAVTRGKVNKPAIGRWTAKNKTRWLWNEWRFHVKYARPQCSASRAIEIIARREKTRKQKLDSLFDNHNLQYTWAIKVIDGPRGPQTHRKNPSSLAIIPSGEEAQTPIPSYALSWWQRRAVAQVEKDLMESNAKVSPCKATWCNMLLDLGIDVLDISGKEPIEYMDADTIPSVLDTPTMYIQMSDLISFGFLLDMELSECNIHKRTINMVGKHCSITSQHQPGVGMLSRYSGLAPNVHPPALECSSSELSMLLHTARGTIQIGSLLTDITALGFNAIDLIFSRAYDKVTEDAWSEVNIRDVMPEIRPDSSMRWEKKWSNPPIPVLPFILSMCSNMAVANAFPHRSLDTWTDAQRKSASETASQHIQDGIGFAEAPTTLFRTMTDKHMRLDLVVMDDFRTANNWGCESGGMRGWLVTNFAEFAVRMSKCWQVQGMVDSVPVLPHFKSLFASGGLDEEWGRCYNANPDDEDKGEGWRMRANTLLWLQIMMFDTWIARKVEFIITGDSSADVSVPVDPKSAAEASSRKENKRHTIGWKKSRLEFTRLYLARLADGVDGKATSFMTVNSEKHLPKSGWDNMCFGNYFDWANIDAVLTLRAVVMMLRLKLMKDSSAALGLKELDPVVQLG